MRGCSRLLVILHTQDIHLNWIKTKHKWLRFRRRFYLNLQHDSAGHMELFNDNLIIITDLPACQISTQLSWLEVLRSLCVHLCSALSFDHNSPRERLQSPNKAEEWFHGFMLSAEKLHRRHPPGIVIVIVTPPNSSFRDPRQHAERGVAEHIESSCKCYATWEQNCASLTWMAAFTTIQVGQDKKTQVNFTKWST